MSINGEQNFKLNKLITSKNFPLKKQGKVIRKFIGFAILFFCEKLNFALKIRLLWTNCHFYDTVFQSIYMLIEWNILRVFIH